MTPEQQYRMLVDGLLLAAAPARVQVSVIPDYACVTDEIMLSFGDSFLLVPQLRAAGLVCDEATDALARLDQHFDSMPHDGSIEDAATLETHRFWAEARRLALEALVAMGETPREPALEGVHYVRGRA